MKAKERRVDKVQNNLPYLRSPNFDSYKIKIKQQKYSQGYLDNPTSCTKGF